MATPTHGRHPGPSTFSRYLAVLAGRRYARRSTHRSTHGAAPGRGRTARWKTPRSTTLLLAALALVLSACGGSNRANFNSQDVGGFRVINAVSDAPNVVFTLETTNIANLSFGQASGFSSIQDGRYDLTARYNTLDNEVNTLLDEERVSVTTGEETTVVLAGTLAAPTPIILEADGANVATDTTELNVLNTSGSGSLDIYLTEPNAALGTALTTVGNNAMSPLVSAAAGTRQVRVTAAGSSAVIFDSGAFELAGGQRILLHIQPYFGPGDAPINVTLIEGARTSSFPNRDLPVRVRIANAISDPVAVDASLVNDGTTEEFTSLAANSFSDGVTLSPGAADISVFMETDPGTTFYTDTAELEGGANRTLIVAGSFSNDTITGRLAVDPVRPLGTAAQLNVMHGAASAGRVDVYVLTADATIATSVVALPDFALLANGTVQLLAGTYSLVFTRANDDTEFAGPVSITVAANQIYNVLLTDAEGGGTPPLIIQGPSFE